MTDRPRVIIEALQVRPDPAGTGRGILDLCAALGARDRGLDFTVLTVDGNLFDHVAHQPHWRIHPCPEAAGGAVRKGLFTQFRLPGLVKRLGGDLLHSMQFLVPLRCPCPQVATVHDMAWRLFPGTIEQPRLSYYRWLVPRSLQKVAAILANSESTAADTRTFFPAVADKIHVTPHGTPRWVQDQVPQAAADEKRPERPFFLFVGTLEPRKNLARVLRAYENFLVSQAAASAPAESVPDLVFVGAKGWLDMGLRKPMENLIGRGRLRVLDYCGLEELGALYRSALALVFPSLHEGFGLPVLEAMASGLPVLTSGKGGTAEVAGGQALLVQPDNVDDIASALGRLAFDETLRARLIAGGYVRARELSWDTTADLTVEVYHGLLASGVGK